MTTPVDATDKIVIRPARPGDLRAMVAITGEVFGPFSMEGHIERMLGRQGRASWLEIKAEDLRRELRRHGPTCFVAEAGGQVVGYVTGVVRPLPSRGTVANLAVAAAWQGRGIGRRLLERAIDEFRRLGLKEAKIETLTTNPVGQHLYPLVGFREVARQIHYVMPLD